MMGSRICKIGPQAVDAMEVEDILWDCELKRFGARRRKSGITYFVKARIDGRQRWLTLGRHGPLTPADARAKAKHALGEIDSGKDPTRDRLPSAPAGKTIRVSETKYTDSWRRMVAHAEAFFDEVRHHESEFDISYCEPSLIKKLQLQIMVCRAHIEQAKSSVRRGAPRNAFVADILPQLVMIADDVGVPTSFTWYDGKTAGPFASFLKVVWEMLPSQRPISAEAFARRIKDLLTDFRSAPQ